MSTGKSVCVWASERECVCVCVCARIQAQSHHPLCQALLYISITRQIFRCSVYGERCEKGKGHARSRLTAAVGLCSPSGLSAVSRHLKHPANDRLGLHTF